ncbi:glycosyltransferase family 2 protein [archaeon]|nr:glycosyltransferase family 2 protein [archaeon]
MNKKIAIIILNWNGTEDTIECLNSIEKNHFKNYKIFLVDNGSSYESVKKLKKLKSKKIELVINKNNLGFAKGNNRVIKKVLDLGFDYFMILNNDVVVGEKFLSKLFDIMKRDDNVGVVSPIVFNYDNKNILMKTNSPGRFNLRKGGGEPWESDLHQIKLRKREFFVDYTSACCWLVRSSMVKKTGGFNERFFAYGEEIELAFRIKKAGYKFLINPAAKIWHKGAASSGRISGFKIYHSTRNMIWLERIHATRGEFLLFLMNLFFIKSPKNVIISLIQSNKFLVLISYFRGLIEGLFTRNNEFNNSKYYKIK